jgi:hypothetical protein
LDKYNGSPGSCVLACFPTHVWVEWKFNFHNVDMLTKNELVSFVREIEEGYNISHENHEEWYTFSLKRILDTKKIAFIKQQGGLHGMCTSLFSFLFFFLFVCFLFVNVIVQKYFQLCILIMCGSMKD